MGLFSKTARIEKTIGKSIEIDAKALQDIDTLKKDMQRLSADFTQENINKSEQDDLEIMHELRKQNPEGHALAKESLNMLGQAHHDPKALQYCERLIESLETSEQLHKKEEEDILHEYHDLIGAKTLSDESINEFLRRHSNFFKTKPNKKLKKRIERELKDRISLIEEHAAGPTVTDRETRIIENRLHEYFNSEYFERFMKLYPVDRIHVNVSMYGSLVTGFASRHSPHKGQPSDYGRVSDVDLGITIDNDALKHITLKGRCLFKEGVYYGPFYERNAEKLGPFQKIFNFVKDLSFAKRTGRKIGFVVVDKHFYNNNMAKEPHKVLFDKDIEL